MCLTATERGSFRSLFGRGAALLLLLVAIAILAILYVMQMEAFFGLVSPGGQSTVEYKPWLEEYRIVPSEKLIKLPRQPKPAISESLTLIARVRLDESERGTAILNFAVSGEVRGTWDCEYSHEDRNYRFDAIFAGNIDITKTYSEGDVADESQLYFITKGTYKQTVYNIETGTESSEEGFVYVTGWLHTDYSVRGRLTITTDRTWSAVYILE